MIILGIHCGHDSSAAIVVNGKLVAAASEERFSRIKNDSSFPIQAVSYCLSSCGISSQDLDCVAIPSAYLHHDLPVFFKIPKGEFGYINIKRRVWHTLQKTLLRNSQVSKALPLYQPVFKLSADCKIHHCEHHLAHAASAYYTSGYHNRNVLIVTMDGVGDNVSSAIWHGQGSKIKPLLKYNSDASIGWFYGNATEGLGWRHGSDEWKVMGLAPYGRPQPGSLRGFYPEFKDGYLIRPHKYGHFHTWNDHGANHYHGRDAALLVNYVDKLGRENYAAEVQRIVEEQSINFFVPWLEKLRTRTICCAGGCFLNVKLNQKLWNSGMVDNQWIYPDAGDAGLAVGAALHAHFTLYPSAEIQKIDNLYLGPEYTNSEIEQILKERGLVFDYYDDPSAIVADYLTKNLAVGWFQGRMETGPRALGARSILMSPLKAENKDLINAKVKYREAFRPFCPAIMYEKAGQYLKNYRDEFFMITSFDVIPGKQKAIPAVVHVDGTLRPQLVKMNVNPRYYKLIDEFGKRTGEYVILNTSFNVKGEPVVCSPRDAVRCFFDTGLDILCIGNYIVQKPSITS